MTGRHTAIAETSEQLDARGLRCPLPVLRARKRLQAMEPGTILEMQADDPAAIVDVPHFCSESGHELVAQRDAGEHRVYLIRKGA